MTTPTPARLRRRNEQYAANINKRGQARAEKQRQKAAEATNATTTTSATRAGGNEMNTFPDEVVPQAAPPKLNPYVAGGILVLLVGSLVAQIFGHLLL
ncbi:hypothetical protein IWQ62_004731 [Dispira parvispora]|uniref:Stress-associated endoplasmic reticulum protein n=1 Tax=Dispira parvispora TaxID=1520584 RepID=A0A9W8AL22_9FUNG|nr:hypothetical protein IWQ62_004731 [Dispira parvispora]